MMKMFDCLFNPNGNYNNHYEIEPLIDNDYDDKYNYNHESSSSALDLSERLESIRDLLNEYKLDYYLVPITDAHASEYVAETDARLAFISGFTGSSGVGIIGIESAHVFTDSRYHIQAERELSNQWTLHKVGNVGVKDWFEYLVTEISAGVRIGVDPKLISYLQSKDLQMNLDKYSSKLLYLQNNLIDIIWSDMKPNLPLKPLFEHELKYSGRHASSKLEDVIKYLGNDKKALVASSLDDIAWVLNVRCQDSVPFNPVFYSYLFISSNRTILFVHTPQLTNNVKNYLSSLNVEISAYDNVFDVLKDINRDYDQIFTSVSVSNAIATSCNVNKVKTITSPITISKSVKNETELEGAKNAYIRDGLAFVRFLSWLDGQVKAKNQNLTEWNVSNKFDQIRSELDKFKGLAYDNISATGANAALPHYSTKKQNSPKLDLSKPYLNDSGGQYLDGTCDTTRTVHFGKPTKEQKRAFTRVLQGHIAIDTLVFPEGTTGGHIDVLARRPLWLDNLDYGHGTGHGIGSYLNVHEGPHGINKGLSFASFPLKVGCMNSNEPGYYEENNFGIRIESVVVVKRSENTSWLKYERLTKVPIDKNLVDYSLLSKFEIDWLNSHNEDVKNTLIPLLGKDEKLTRKWLLSQ